MMKLFIVLVLSLQLFSSRVELLSTENANCSDPIIFHAMDVALRTYNAERQDGKQFALHRIINAKATLGNDTYIVSYNVFETSCEVGDGKSWQECDYKPEAEAQRGQCTAQVYINKPEKSEQILYQHCNINPAESLVTPSHVPCLGCHKPIPANSVDLLKPLKHALQKFNSDSQHPSLFDIGEIRNPTRQVIAGWMYHFDYIVKETNCSKKEFSELNPHCKHLENGKSGDCNAQVYIDLHDVVADIKQSCNITAASFCADCTVPVDTNSQELHEPLKQVVEKFNAEDNGSYHYDLAHVYEAKTQSIPGMKYRIKLHMAETNCSKELYEKLTDDCQFKDGGNEHICSAMVRIAPTEEADPLVDCFPYNLNSMNLRGIPGLSPFRFAKRTYWEQPRSKPGLRLGHGKSQGHGHMHQHGCGHGHHHGHDHGKGKKPKDKKDKDKKKHDKKKCESSEESDERITIIPRTTFTPTVPEEPRSTHAPVLEEPTTSLNVYIIDEETTSATAVDNTEAIIPDLPMEPEIPFINLPDESTLDLPAPPLKTCPGKEWKPVSDINTNPDILTDPSEKKPIIEKNESVDPEIPAIPGTFSDSDLLL